MELVKFIVGQLPVIGKIYALKKGKVTTYQYFLGVKLDLLRSYIYLFNQLTRCASFSSTCWGNLKSELYKTLKVNHQVSPTQKQT
jgi:hypothetical protein